MSSTSAPARYGSFLIGLHWLTLILVIAIFVSVQAHEAFPRGSTTRSLMMMTHFSLGIVVFLLVWLRLATRLFGAPAPRIEPPLAGWHGAFSSIVHLALYGLMIALPVIGCLMVNANGRAVPFFGLELPVLIAADKALGHSLKEVHEVAGNLFYILAILHAAAALFHHYVLRNNTLRRILPFATA